MRPYSLDLRQKIIHAYQNQQISIRQLALNFGVAKSFVQKILKQYRETSDLRARCSRGRPEDHKKEVVMYLLLRQYH